MHVKGVDKKNGQIPVNRYQVFKSFSILHDLIISPKDAVLVEIFWRIEPEPISLLSSYASASISIDIRLYSPLLSSDIPQEFKIQFVVIFLEYITIRHLIVSKKSNSNFISYANITANEEKNRESKAYIDQNRVTD